MNLIMQNEKINQEEIDDQVRKTEERGQQIVDYLKKYEGQPIYNEIALAIEFGFQLCLADFEEYADKIYEKRKEVLLDLGMLFSFEYDSFWTKKDKDFIILVSDVKSMDEFEFSGLLSEIDQVLNK